ncbi:MAG: hypothetical protein ACD_56C00045G0003 [uncultured bacterium]|nr:MAG: hypothetical protein ACD_56C00045G0003 [uncultured bacterium]
MKKIKKYFKLVRRVAVRVFSIVSTVFQSVFAQKKASKEEVFSSIELYGAYGSHGIDHNGFNEEGHKLRRTRLQRSRY